MPGATAVLRDFVADRGEEQGELWSALRWELMVVDEPE
jgi:hypothetical protein